MSDYRHAWKRQALQHVLRAYPIAARLRNRTQSLRIGRRMLDEVLRHLPEAGDVLDYGCGDGWLSIYLAMALPNIRMRGIDADPRRIQRARDAVRRLAIDGVEFEAADAQRYRPPDRVSTILMIDLVRQLPRAAVESLLCSAADALTPGGRLLIKETEPSFQSSLGVVCGRVLDSVMHRCFPYPRWARAELPSLLEHGGFSVSTHDIAGFPCRPQMLYVAVKPSLPPP